MNLRSPITMSVLLLSGVFGSCHGIAQQTAAPAPIERRDPTLDLASAEIGRALFLRCLCADDNLGFDAQGRPAAGMKLKPVDWTLAGINVTKVDRKGQNEIELDGVRVVIRFASDRHEFERHPQKDEAVKITLADNGDPAAFERALGAVFAIGIDRPLQKSMPEFWQHYFEPAKPWPPNSPDALTGQTIYNTGAPAGPATGDAVAAPVVTRKADASYTTYAAHDKIRGAVRLRLVVDAGGVPRRISVAVPLGYGLDQAAVEAAEKLRFAPAMMDGQPVAANFVVDQQFVAVPPPGAR